jgi:hypothetical protein
MKDKLWEVLDRKALGTLWLCLTMSMDFKISKENTKEDLMNVVVSPRLSPCKSDISNEL